MSKRYARQIALADVGAEGQAKLGRARVLVVGLGGLGCPAALYLATSGIGRLVLNDFDRVDETNLPRQILYRPEDVGALKVEAAKKRLTALNPDVEVVVLAERLDGAALEAAVGDVDVVLDGTDNFAARFAVNRACVARARAARLGRRRARRRADRRVSERRRRPLLRVPLQRRGRMARRLPGQRRARARAGRHRHADGRGSAEARARLGFRRCAIDCCSGTRSAATGRASR